jgi:hypothetical protein
LAVAADAAVRDLHREKNARPDGPSTRCHSKYVAIRASLSCTG